MNPNIPWSIDHDRINDATGREVARIAPRLHGSQNRSLIAAAPDLLAVLCEVRDIGVLSCCCERPNGKCCGTCTATKIDAAIAKAKGGAK